MRERLGSTQQLFEVEMYREGYDYRELLIHGDLDFAGTRVVDDK